jgi:hypothetical protein
MVDYPRASFARALKLAESVDYLGGKCTFDTCSHKMGMTVNGGFKDIVGAAVKFNLVQNSKGSLTNTELYKLIKYAYNDEEKVINYRKAFFSAPIFNNIYDRFKGKELPIEMLDKILIREFGIDESITSRVKKYFIEGAKFIGILDEKNILATFSLEENTTAEIIEPEPENTNNGAPDNSPATIKPSFDNFIILNDSSKEYIVHIKGPDIDSRIIINEEEDLDIVNVMLNKLRKKVKQQ